MKQGGEISLGDIEKHKDAEAGACRDGPATPRCRRLFLIGTHYRYQRQARAVAMASRLGMERIRPLATASGAKAHSIKAINVQSAMRRSALTSFMRMGVTPTRRFERPEWGVAAGCTMFAGSTASALYPRELDRRLQPALRCLDCEG